MFILGTDEAGYGPNLGPLVISVSVWTAERDLSGTEMYKRLRPVALQASNKKELKSTSGAFLLDDSKKLYKGRDAAGLKHLEYALLSSLRSLGRFGNDASVSDLFNALAICNDQTYQLPPWEKPESTPLPIDADKSCLDETTAAFKRIQEESGIHLTDLRSDVVFPARFNAQCEAMGNKSTLLSKTTLNLLKLALKNCPGETVVWCDKHGGRNFYADLLNECFNESSEQQIVKNRNEKDNSDQLSLFDDCEKQDEQPSPDFVEILEQSESISSYRFTWQGCVRTIHFQAKSDCSPPAALASIACKYLRELFMNQFNEYWQKKVPGLEPTAGYPVDAKRFLEQVKTKIDFPMDQLWRKK